MFPPALRSLINPWKFIFQMKLIIVTVNKVCMVIEKSHCELYILKKKKISLCGN